MTDSKHRGLSAVSVLTALALAACPGPRTTTDTDKPPLDPNNKPDEKGPAIELPAVPATLETRRVTPEAGHTPAARSPILDIMVAENQRWMETLRKDKSAPAYYMAYAIHEKRVVTYEADGGSLVNRDDEIDRYLDVEIRVGTPQLDNRRTIDGDQGAINEALSRQVFAPFGSDRLAIVDAKRERTERRHYVDSRTEG